MDGARVERAVLSADGEDPAVLAGLVPDLESRTATTLSGALAHLEDASCVVTTNALADADGVALIEAVRERDADLPIVFTPRDGSEELAARATAAGATRYLPRNDAPDSLSNAIEDLLGTYERRRSWHRDSTILQSVLDGFQTPFFVKDRAARHLMTSDPPAGWSHGEVLGTTDLDLYSEDDPDHARQAYEDDLHVVETGEPILDQVERIDADDYTAWIRTSKVPWRDEDGEIRGLVGIARDVTESQEYKHELERERARSERFANYIAHDLRNPLNVARGYLELASEMDDTEPLEDVEDALDRMEEVIDDVLALVGRERDEPPIEQGSLREPLMHAWETVETDDATLAVEIPEGTQIAAGQSHLQELFENLIRNSVEHGGDSVTVRVGLLPDGFYVEDDGEGIEPQDREAVLEYGYTTRDAGTGIGLAVVTELADVYDWDVAVDESECAGARFEFRRCLLVSEPSGSSDRRREIDFHGSVDVGSAEPPGSADRQGDAWVVRGAGEDVWSDQDQLHFAYAPLAGDGRITARLADLDVVEEYTKAGVMIRADLESGSPLGHVGLTAERGSEVLWCGERSARIESIPIDLDASAPLWLRLERRDDRVTASISTDGDAWMRIDQRRLDLPEMAYAGLAVCSHRQGTLATARFEDVEVVRDDAG